MSSKKIKEEKINEENLQQEHTETVEDVKKESDFEATSKDDFEAKYNEINDKYLRLYSEFDNFRKRSSKEKIEILGQANANVIKDLLPILDDFDRAFSANDKASDSFYEGISLIQTKFKKALTDKGLKPIESTGEKFDVELHEAITNFPAEKEKDKGKVVDTVEKGYYLNDKVLRFAKVVVGQ